MKRPSLATGLSKPIETNFVTVDFLPEALGLDVKARKFTAEDVPRVAEALEWNEKEWLRVEKQAVDRFERLFPLHEVDRTGDDAGDFQRLSLKLAERLNPRAGVGMNPEKIELFFNLYDVPITGNPAFDFMRLICRLAEEIYPGVETVSGPHPCRLTRGNPRALLLLLADVETVKQMLRPKKCSSNEAIRYLIKNKPYNSQWGSMTDRNLANWLCEARNPQKNDLLPLWESHELLGTLPALIKAIHRGERVEGRH